MLIVVNQLSMMRMQYADIQLEIHKGENVFS